MAMCVDGVEEIEREKKGKLALSGSVERTCLRLRLSGMGVGCCSHVRGSWSGGST